ncbi:MAG: hypothetical protein ACI8QC_002011 [Planctomycetota bacterium]|jgi:hypothetical protein
MHRSPRFVSLVCALLLALASCGRGAPDEYVELISIERLAFVSSGRIELGQGHTLGSDVDLLVGLHEITRGEWRSWADERDVAWPPEPAFGPWLEGTDNLPATGMDLADARAFAASSGLRIPSVMEWAWCATGQRGLPYPYAVSPSKSAGNTLEVGLDRPASVGTFPNGRTPITRIADLFGNVEEWASPIPEENWQPSHSKGSAAIGLSAWAMGGSWRDPWQRLYGLSSQSTLLGRELEPTHRAEQLGLRVVAEARYFLRSQAESFSDPELRERVTAVGERWGAEALQLLSSLAVGRDVPLGILWLLEGARR